MVEHEIINTKGAVELLKDVFGIMTVREAEWIYREQWPDLYDPKPLTQLTAILQDTQRSQLLLEVLDRVLQAVDIVPHTKWVRGDKPFSQHERRTIIKRYDLDGKGKRTLEKISQEFGVTHQCVRQYEYMALRKLRQPDRTGLLRPFLRETVT